MQTIAVVCSDLLATIVAFLLAYWLRFVLQITPPKDLPGDLPTLSTYLLALPLILVLWHFTFVAFGLRRLHVSTDAAAPD